MSSLSDEELLELGDEDLFRGGGCHVFADELYDALKSKGFVLRRIAEGAHPRRAAYHVYVASGDTAIDRDGIKTESGMLAGYIAWRRENNYPQTDYKAFSCQQKTLFEVCEIASDSEPHNCWYHRIGEHFVKECRRRARAMIASSPAKYFPPD